MCVCVSTETVLLLLELCSLCVSTLMCKLQTIFSRSIEIVVSVPLMCEHQRRKLHAASMSCRVIRAAYVCRCLWFNNVISSLKNMNTHTLLHMCSSGVAMCVCVCCAVYSSSVVCSRMSDLACPSIN